MRTSSTEKQNITNNVDFFSRKNFVSEIFALGNCSAIVTTVEVIGRYLNLMTGTLDPSAQPCKSPTTTTLAFSRCNRKFSRIFSVCVPFLQSVMHPQLQSTSPCIVNNCIKLARVSGVCKYHAPTQRGGGHKNKRSDFFLMIRMLSGSSCCGLIKEPTYRFFPAQ